MSTKAQLVEELKETQSQLKAALENSVDGADASTLSSVLVNKVQELRSEAEDTLGEAEEAFQKLEDLYSVVDDADDAVIVAL